MLLGGLSLVPLIDLRRGREHPGLLLALPVGIGRRAHHVVDCEDLVSRYDAELPLLIFFLGLLINIILATCLACDGLILLLVVLVAAHVIIRLPRVVIRICSTISSTRNGHELILSPVFKAKLVYSAFFFFFINILVQLHDLTKERLQWLEPASKDGPQLREAIDIGWIIVLLLVGDVTDESLCEVIAIL